MTTSDRASRRSTARRHTRNRGRTRRRSERLEAYYSTVPGLMSADTPRLQLPPPEEVRAWVKSHRTPLTIIGVLCLLLVWFFVTDEFYVYQANIEGTRLLTVEEIYNEAQLEGLSIFWVDPPTLKARLEENPLIKEAHVTAVLPHHVTIRIVEREPVAVWQSGTESLYVDAEGQLFPLRGDATGAVVIRDLRGEEIRANTTVDTEAVQTSLGLADLLEDRRAFDWEPAEGVSFITDGGWRVIFGDHYRLTMKADAYESFARQIAPFEKVEFLDLSAPEHPYYRLLP